MRKLAYPMVCLTIAASSVTAQVTTGPSSSRSPYVLPSIPGAKSTSILTAGDTIGGYRMAGVPDGLGAFDNGNGTFTLVMNHELGNTSGAVHAHGSTGAFVSKWIINKSNLSVISGGDLIQNVKFWNTATNSYVTYNAANPNTAAAFARFCSADMAAPSAFYNAATGKGTQERMFLNGEENGNDGRAMAHIVTGPNAGTSYELPRLGNMSFENSVANPATGDMTVVAVTDDATPGQVYFYIGTKQTTGTEIEKAGLTNGSLYSMGVSGMLTESSATFAAPNTPFTMINLGNVENMNGGTLETNSNNAGVTRFLRPEDGAWDPRHPEDFYFVTTNAFNAPSRLWKVHFNNLNNLTLGGTITAVLDGTEGQQMLDNITIDQHGHVLLQEDPGGQAYIAKMWQYEIATDKLTQIAQHDPARFQTGGANFLTTDEESSGILDVQNILGAGWFLAVDQTHYSIPSPIVEGGQLFAFFNPASYDSACAGFAANISVSPSTPVPGQQMNTIYLGYGPTSVSLTASAPATNAPLSYSWTPAGTGATGTVNVSPTATTKYYVTIKNRIGCTATDSQVINVVNIQDGNKNKVFICHNGHAQSVSVNAVPAHLAHGDLLGNCPSTARMASIAAEEAFIVFPNPATGDATVRMTLTESKSVNISVVDMQGRKVADVANSTFEAGSYVLQIPASTLTSGIYFVQINAGGALSQIKFVVAH